MTGVPESSLKNTVAGLLLFERLPFPQRNIVKSQIALRFVELNQPPRNSAITRRQGVIEGNGRGEVAICYVQRYLAPI
jgi:hypothetical protein